MAARWLVDNKGATLDAARRTVASEFPTQFAAFAAGAAPSAAAWDDALLCGGHRADARAKWLVDNKGATLEVTTKRTKPPLGYPSVDPE